MGNSQLEAAQRQERIERGAYTFFLKHSELNSCDANVSILSNFILAKGLPLDSIASWETAFQNVQSQLAPPVKTQTKVEEPTPEPEPASWPHSFCPPIYTYKDVQRLPGKLYRDLWYDSVAGKLTQKAITFRALVNEIITRENERRAQ